MAIKTRQTDGTGVTNNDAPLTNAELDNNFIELVAEDATKADLTGAAFTGQVTISTSTENALDILAGTNNQRLLRLSHPTSPADAGGYFDFNSDGTTDNNVVTFGVEYSGTDYDVLNIQRSTQYVGIGTSNPLNALHIKTDAANSNAQIRLQNDAITYIVGPAGTDNDHFNIYDATSTATRFKIDTSGNVMIATSDSALYNNTTGSGFCYRPGLSLDIARESTAAQQPMLVLNETGVDGDIAQFRKDGVTVGVIGTTSSGLTIGSGDTGLFFDSAEDSVKPRNSTGEARDNAIDLGKGSHRFKDLYLSGDANIDTDINLTVTDSSVPLRRIRFDKTGNSTNTNGAGAYIQFDTSTGSTERDAHNARIEGIRSDAGNGSAQLDFYTSQNISPSDLSAKLRVRIEDNGDVAISQRLLNSHGARLHNEPASGLRGTGMNMTDAGAIDTGVNTTTAARGLVWTGKHYLLVMNSDGSGNAAVKKLESDLSAGEFIDGSDQLTLPRFNCHGAVWDGRYLWTVGFSATDTTYRRYLQAYDVEKITSGQPELVAEISVQNIIGNRSCNGLGYVEGRFWLSTNNIINIVDIDLASNTAINYATTTGLDTVTAQFVTYDGSHVYWGSNGTAIYKANPDGTTVTSVSTGVIPDCTALTWNGQEFIGVEYDVGNIWAIPVTHETYSDYQSQGQMIVGYGSNDPDLSGWTYPDVLVGGFPDGNHDDADGMAGYKFGVISDLNNGGNAPAMRKNQIWVTGGVGGDAYNSFAAWDVGRWSNVGTDARSRLDLYLGDNTADRGHAMTWLYDEDRPRVGINTTNPDVALEIYNPDSGSSNELYDPSLKISTNVSGVDNFLGLSPSQIRYRRETSTAVPLRIQTYVPAGSSGGHISFEPNSDSTNYTPVQRMVITKEGNVGINTATPSYKLDVTGDTRFNGVLRINSDDAAAEPGTDMIIGDITSSNDAYVEFHADNGRWCQHLFYFDGVTAGTHDLWRVGAHKDTSEDFYRIYSRTRAKEMARFDAQNDQINFEANSITHYGAQPKFNLRNQSSSTNSRGTYVLWQDSDGTQTAYVGFGSSSNDNFIINQTKAADMLFYVNGSARLTIDSGGDATFSGEVTVNSDERIKDNIEQIDGAIEKVQAIRGVTFTRKDTEDDRTHVGVIAQEVEKVLPEVVKEGEDGIKSVAYANMVGLLIEAIKEQQTQIDDLKAEVTRLKGFE